jgi:hypothetical protein
MPIGPMGLTGLASIAGGVATQLPDLLPSSYERSQKKKLEDLQRQQELGLLGLNEQERSQLEARLQSRSQAAEQQSSQNISRLLAGGGQATGGQALLNAQLASEARQRAETEIARQIEDQNIAKRQQQIDEIAALEAGQAEYKAKRKAALGGIAATTLEGALRTAAQTQYIQGARAPNEQTVNAYAKLYGISPEEARGMIEMAAQYPELNFYQQLLSETKTGERQPGALAIKPRGM